MYNIGGAWLTVNRFCNFRCQWCYAKDTKFRPEDDMTLDLAVKVVRFLAEIGVEEVIYIGGEPSFWKYLFTIDNLVHELGMHSAIVTNGYLFHHPRWLAKFEESQIDYINISIKAGNPQQHMELTQTSPDTFEKVLQGIRNAASLGREINVSTVVNSLVLNNIDQIVEVAASCGVHEIFLQLCTPEFIDGQPQKGLMIPPQEIARVLGEKYATMNKVTHGGIVIEGTIPNCVWDPELLKVLLDREQIALGCQLVSRNGLVFNSKGSLIPCNHLFDYPYGTLGKDFVDAGTFAAFWESPEVLTMHQQITAYPDQKCITCSMHTECGGGCPLQWFVYEPYTVVKGG